IQHVQLHTHHPPRSDVLLSAPPRRSSTDTPATELSTLSLHDALPISIATTLVEVVRGVPLIAVLYLAVLVFPLALPPAVTLDKLLLVQGAVALFASAYLAEAVRSGLQMVPLGRMEAAHALGLGWWPAMRLVILPGAL